MAARVEVRAVAEGDVGVRLEDPSEVDVVAARAARDPRALSRVPLRQNSLSFEPPAVLNWLRFASSAALRLFSSSSSSSVSFSFCTCFSDLRSTRSNTSASSSSCTAVADRFRFSSALSGAAAAGGGAPGGRGPPPGGAGGPPPPVSFCRKSEMRPTSSATSWPCWTRRTPCMMPSSSRKARSTFSGLSGASSRLSSGDASHAFHSSASKLSGRMSAPDTPASSESSALQRLVRRLRRRRRDRPRPEIARMYPGGIGALIGGGGAPPGDGRCAFGGIAGGKGGGACLPGRLAAASTRRTRSRSAACSALMAASVGLEDMASDEPIDERRESGARASRGGRGAMAQLAAIGELRNLSRFSATDNNFADADGGAVQRGKPVPRVGARGRHRRRARRGAGPAGAGRRHVVRRRRRAGGLLPARARNLPAIWLLEHSDAVAPTDDAAHPGQRLRRGRRVVDADQGAARAFEAALPHASPTFGSRWSTRSARCRTCAPTSSTSR